MHKQFPPPTHIGVWSAAKILAELWPEKKTMAVGKAFDVLWKEARAGQIEVIGTNQQNEDKIISAHELQRLELDPIAEASESGAEYSDGAAFLPDRRHFGRTVTKYRGLKFSHRDVFTLLERLRRVEHSQENCDQIPFTDNLWKAEAPRSRKRGAKKGQGEIDDTTHLTRIAELVAEGKSVHAAAQSVAAEIGISGHALGATVDRWRRKYRQRYPAG